MGTLKEDVVIGGSYTKVQWDLVDECLNLLDNVMRIDSMSDDKIDISIGVEVGGEYYELNFKLIYHFTKGYSAGNKEFPLQEHAPTVQSAIQSFLLKASDEYSLKKTIADNILASL